MHTFHLSPTSCDQDLGLTKADKVALFQLRTDFYCIHPDMWHWEGQAEPAGRLRPYYHLCLQDIRDFVTYPHGQEICRAADLQWLWNQPLMMSCSVKHFEKQDGAYLSRSSVVTARLWGGIGRSPPSKCLGGVHIKRNILSSRLKKECGIHVSS